MVNFFSKLRKKTADKPDVFGMSLEHAAFWAEELSKNELLLRVFEDNKRKIFELWGATHHDNISGREELYARLKAIERLELDIQGIINSNRLEAAKLEQLKASAHSGN